MDPTGEFQVNAVITILPLNTTTKKMPIATIKINWINKLAPLGSLSSSTGMLMCSLVLIATAPPQNVTKIKKYLAASSVQGIGTCTA